MLRLISLFICLLAAAAAASTSDRPLLRCFHCTSASEPGCLDPFTPDTATVMSCKAASPEDPRSEFAPAGAIEAPVCIRYDGVDEDGRRYTVRGCSRYGKETCNSLLRAAAAEGSILENCEACTEDFCNVGARGDMTRAQTGVLARSARAVRDFFGKLF